jgi:hypothetical protein
MINKLSKIIFMAATVLCVPLNGAQTSGTLNNDWEEFGPGQVYEASRMDPCCVICICACMVPVACGQLCAERCVDLLAATPTIVQSKRRLLQPQDQKMK